MKRWLALPAACLALGLVAAGCGSSSNDKSGGGSTSSNTTATQPAAPSTGGGGGASTAQVTMKNIQFVPSNVTVAKGGTVTWTNDEAVGHDVTGDGFKSGAPGGLQQGATFKHTFAKAGTYKYVCTVHAPGMKGTVTVK